MVQRVALWRGIVASSRQLVAGIGAGIGDEKKSKLRTLFYLLYKVYS